MLFSVFLFLFFFFLSLFFLFSHECTSRLDADYPFSFSFLVILFCVRNFPVGAAGVVGNKGGVVIATNVYDTRLCFVNSHLAAHQHKTQKRNEDIEEIIKGI